ncbi:MAG: retropepsin-like domain-containing protein [Cyclobacteriaceae bacterium]|nr:retropepsin-like domain-containing protein [Cyclobacteriaceae bacterium]MCH8516829.1 retropepsin-like domain-containing protein [Cyclobacteriaceae bacterium]
MNGKSQLNNLPLIQAMKHALFIIFFVLLLPHTKAQQANDSISIPFDMIDKGLLIEAVINGEKGTFLFDTGFTHGVLSPEFAQRAGVHFKRSNKNFITDANGSRKAAPIRVIKEVSIGKLTFKNAKFYLLDVNTTFPCEAVDGIIGNSMISVINWKIDYSKKTIALSRVPFEMDGFKFTTQKGKHHLSFTQIDIQNQSLYAMIDFGATSNHQEVELHTATALKLFDGFEVIEKTGIQSISAHGLGKPTTQHLIAKKMTIKIGDKAFPIPNNVSLKENLKYPAVIKAAFFANYQKVVINSTDEAYILYGENEYKTPAFRDIKNYGLGIYSIDGKWRLIQKDRDNPLLATVPLFEEVKLIDDQPIANMDICDYKAYMEARTNTDSLKITFMNGKVVKLPAAVSNTSRLK